MGLRTTPRSNSFLISARIMILSAGENRCYLATNVAQSSLIGGNSGSQSMHAGTLLRLIGNRPSSMKAERASTSWCFCRAPSYPMLASFTSNSGGGVSSLTASGDGSGASVSARGNGGSTVDDEASSASQNECGHARVKLLGVLIQDYPRLLHPAYP